MAELGGGVPTKVRFQALNISEVDDFIIEGSAEGHVKVAAVAARINPKLVSSDTKSVSLFTKFLSEFGLHTVAMKNGSWRLVLVSESVSVPPTELYRLAGIARAHESEASFFQAVQLRNDKLIARMDTFRDFFQASAKGLSVPSPGVWEVLKALVVEQHRFDEPSPSEARAQALLDRFCKGWERVPTPAVSFEALASVSSDLAHNAGTVSRESLIETLIRRNKLPNPETLGPSASNDTVSLHRRVLYTAASVLSDERFHPKDWKLRELMRGETLHELLDAIPPKFEEFARSKRILTQHAAGSSLGDHAGQLIESAQSARSSLSSLISGWDEISKEKEQRLEFGWEDPAIVHLRSQNVESYLSAAVESLATMQTAALFIRDSVEKEHPEDAVPHS
ncbi:hypothetical protein ACIP9X_19140 [Arthrobacter sp. NPDC093125]|uniref:hypothetical protein n=1 Tax=Arthrobacter sp. NPDC093125 TaxID=3363944 RepID=UPI003829B1DC